MDMQIEDDDYLGFPLAQDSPPDDAFRCQAPENEFRCQTPKLYTPLRLEEESYDEFWQVEYFPRQPEEPIMTLKEMDKESRQEFESLKKTLVSSVRNFGRFTYSQDQAVIVYTPMLPYQPQVKILMTSSNEVCFYTPEKGRYKAPHRLRVGDCGVSGIMRMLTRPDGEVLPYSLRNASSNLQQFHIDFEYNLELTVQRFNASTKTAPKYCFIEFSQMKEEDLTFGEYLHSYTLRQHRYGVVTPLFKVVLSRDNKVHCVTDKECFTYTLTTTTLEDIVDRINTAFGLV